MYATITHGGFFLFPTQSYNSYLVDSDFDRLLFRLHPAEFKQTFSDSDSDPSWCGVVVALNALWGVLELQSVVARISTECLVQRYERWIFAVLSHVRT